MYKLIFATLMTKIIELQNSKIDQINTIPQKSEFSENFNRQKMYRVVIYWWSKN